MLDTGLQMLGRTVESVSPVELRGRLHALLSQDAQQLAEDSSAQLRHRLWCRLLQGLRSRPTLPRSTKVARRDATSLCFLLAEKLGAQYEKAGKVALSSGWVSRLAGGQPAAEPKRVTYQDIIKVESSQILGAILASDSPDTESRNRVIAQLREYRAFQPTW